MCDCLKSTNALLAEHNTKIMLPMLGPQLPFVQTMKLDEKKRGKPAYMFASFCPFCGEKYSRAQSQDILNHQEAEGVGR